MIVTPWVASNWPSLWMYEIAFGTLREQEEEYVIENSKWFWIKYQVFSISAANGVVSCRNLATECVCCSHKKERRWWWVRKILNNSDLIISLGYFVIMKLQKVNFVILMWTTSPKKLDGPNYHSLTIHSSLKTFMLTWQRQIFGIKNIQRQLRKKKVSPGHSSKMEGIHLTKCKSPANAGLVWYYCNFLRVVELSEFFKSYSQKTIIVLFDKII